MNQKERVFWSDLMGRIEPDATMFAAAEARLRAEADAPIDERRVRAQIASIVDAETQTRTRQRRRRLGAVAMIALFVLPALALGTRALLWQSTGPALDTMTYSDATGIMWVSAEARRGFALGVLTSRVVTAVDAFRAVQSDKDATVANRGVAHMATLLNAIDHGAEPSSMPMDDDWQAMASIATDGNLDPLPRLTQLDRLAVLAVGALHVMQHSPHAAEGSDVEIARVGLLRHLRKRVTGEEIRHGR